MRVLLVTRGFPPAGRWGSEGYAHDLARGLVARGHRVDVFFPLHGTSRTRGEVARVREVEAGLRVFEFPLAQRLGKPFPDSYLDPRQDSYVARLCAEEGPYDRLHLCALAGGVSAGILRALRPLVGEIVVTLTEFLPFCHRGQLLDAELAACPGPEPKRCSACLCARGPYGEGASRLPNLMKGILFAFGRLTPLASPEAFAARERTLAEALAGVDSFVAPSQALLERYVALGVAPEKIHYLPYALDPGRYARHRPADPGERLRVAFLGQLAPHKGCHVLLGALPGLTDAQRARLRLTLHGASNARSYPGYATALAELAARYPESVELAGPFPPDEVDLVLSETDCVVLPSVWLENLPLVVLHARACGLPILGSSEAGIAAFVEDDVDGLVVETGNAAAWTKALARLLTEPELLPRLREGARRARVPIEYEAHLGRIEALGSG